MEDLKPKIIRLHSSDDVCVAIDLVAKGIAWEGIVASYGIHMHYITPKQWMSRFNIPKFKDRQDRKRYLKMRPC